MKKPHRHCPSWIFLLTSIFCVAASVHASGAEDEGPATITREQADVIIEELRAVRELLERLVEPGTALRADAKAPGPVRVATAGRPALGSVDAPVTVVEFTDYECPFCKRFHQTTFATLKRDYIDSGKVRWVVRDLPLPFHPNAQAAAQAVHCAGEQGKFFEMRSKLFARAGATQPDAILGVAADIGLDEMEFAECRASKRHQDAIDRDARDAESARISGTPTFVVGRTEGGWVEGQHIVGAQSFAVFDSAIRTALREAADSPGSGP